MANGIPIVDFSCLSLGVGDEELNADDVELTSGMIVNAFTSIGFVYLKNTGVSSALIDKFNHLAKGFFLLPSEVKAKYPYNAKNNHGWVPIEGEGVNPTRPSDLKECFNVTLDGIQRKLLPEEREMEEFSRAMLELFDVCTRLAHRVLRAIAIGLKLEDPEFLIQRHNTKTVQSGTTLRALYYPPIRDEVKPGQLRLGEHTDYGTLTLLFQDDIGGLQVATRAGEWVDAVPIDSTVLVNIADLLQRWTADQLVSTKHRILLPQLDDSRRLIPRQSTVFFFHPDNDTLVTPLDGSKRYDSISAKQYLANRLDLTYEHNLRIY